jgi:hypothetical protein
MEIIALNSHANIAFFPMIVFIKVRVEADFSGCYSHRSRGSLIISKWIFAFVGMLSTSASFQEHIIRTSIDYLGDALGGAFGSATAVCFMFAVF